MSLPLVKYVTDSFDDANLEQVTIIGAQHLLGTTVDLFKHLFTKGLKPKNIYLIGKCYSSSRLAAKELEKIGAYVCPKSFFFKSDCSFDKQYTENLRSFLLRVLPRVNKNHKIIILDDGGYLIRTVHQFLPDLSNVYGVEQTTSGYNALRKFKLRLPVINVARSSAKLLYESPMIAEAVAKHVKQSIESLSLCGTRALILGGGAIGCSIYERFKTDFDTVIYDSQNELSMIPEAEFLGWLSNSDLVIGCTGKTVLPATRHKILKQGVVLVSASSSDREFDAVSLRKSKEFYTNPHLDIQERGIHLLNSGFPINFDGRKHSVPPKLIQLTRSLLAAAIFQIFSGDFTYNGLVDLDVELQRNILEKFFVVCGREYRRLLKKTGKHNLLKLARTS